MEVFLRISEISKSFGDIVALNKVSFEIQKGECFGLLGPNGAGKTTLIRILMGLTIPDNGEIILKNKRIKNPLSIRKIAGYVAQDELLDEELTVFENLYMHGLFHGLRLKESKERADELLRFFELSHRKNYSVKTLSGGMRKKLAIAKSLIHDPQLLIMDEPTIGLDPLSRKSLWDIIVTLRNSGKTILLTTHYMEEAEFLCDTVSIINKGEIVEIGKPDEIIRRHIPEQVLEVKPSDIEEKRVINSYLQEKRLPFITAGEKFIIFDQNPESVRGELFLRGVNNVIKRKANLEDVFIHLTGKELISNETDI